MKSLLYSILFAFVFNPSFAQNPVPDTTKMVVRRGPCIYYIDGVKVNSCDSIRDSIMTDEEVQIIIGGLPIVYGDINSSLIQISPTPPAETDRKKIRKRSK